MFWLLLFWGGGGENFAFRNLIIILKSEIELIVGSLKKLSYKTF